MNELAFRARRILYATVSEYIAEGAPVGSQRLSKRYGLSVSPATIRNELAELEDCGYLAQPHSSAGRVPTDKGFRAFVDAQLDKRSVDPLWQASVCEHLDALVPGADDLPLEVSRVLSDLTSGASVHCFWPTQSPISELRFVPVGQGRLLTVLVMKSGQVESRAVLVESLPEKGELERIHNYLAELTASKALTLRQVRDQVEQAAETDRSEFLLRAREVVNAAWCAVPAAEVVVGGQNRLLGQRDFADVEKMRRVLEALEEKEHLLELLDATLEGPEVEVRIGEETGLDKSPNLTLIAASFGHEGRCGSLAIVAPTRVDYRKVVPIVGFAARALTARMEGKRLRQ